MSRWIDADALIDTLGISDEEIEFKEILREAPSADIVRCQDCKYWNYEMSGCKRNPSVVAWRDNDFCSYGERKNDEG